MVVGGSLVKSVLAQCRAEGDDSVCSSPRSARQAAEPLKK